MTGFLMISNRNAGSAEQDDLEAALRVLRAGAAVDSVSAGDPDELDDRLDRLDVRRLVVAGGDGSLHLMLGRLYARGELAETTIGLIPLGTGNDFARGSGVPLDVSEAARLVLEGAHRPVDLIVDDQDEVVVNNAHVGLSSEASRYGARWKGRLGRIGYPLGVAQAAVKRPFRLDVEVDQELVAGSDRPILEVSIGNGATVGGGLPLNPDADPTDGRLDVIVSRAAGPLTRLTYGWDVVRAQHPARKDVDRFAAVHVSVTGSPFHVSADGEIYGPTSSRSWRIERKAFTMVLPSGR